MRGRDARTKEVKSLQLVTGKTKMREARAFLVLTPFAEIGGPIAGGCQGLPALQMRATKLEEGAPNLLCLSTRCEADCRFLSTAPCGRIMTSAVIGQSVLTSRLSATRMTPFVIARAPRRRKTCSSARTTGLSSQPSHSRSRPLCERRGLAALTFSRAIHN